MRMSVPQLTCAASAFHDDDVGRTTQHAGVRTVEVVMPKPNGDLYRGQHGLAVRVSRK